MAVSIRRADVGDLSVVADLVRIGAERTYSDAVIFRALGGLEPTRHAVWLAEANGTIVGMSALQIRTIQWRGAAVRAGYWTNLVVRREHRQTAAYPSLVRGMIRGAKGIGLSFVYGGIRRVAVAEGHVALGFSRVGDIPVVAKPLRPVRGFARTRNYSHAVQLVAAVPDALWRGVSALSGLRYPGDGKEVQVTAGLSQLGALRDNAPQESVVWAWDDILAHGRFASNYDGEAYGWASSGAAGSADAAIGFRVADRAHGLRLGVIVAALRREGASGALAQCLRVAEDQLSRGGADVILALPGWDAGAAAWLRARGYFSTRERYVLLWKPLTSDRFAAPPPLAQWRFDFTDHDAF